MKFRNYLAVSVMLVSLTALSISCTTEMDYEKSGISEITATIGDGNTKTVLADNMTSILWSPNDDISVFYNGEGVKFTSINTTPKDQTIFRSQYSLIYGGTETSDGSYIYAVYPYSDTNKQEGEEITLTVPAFQTAVEGSFGRGAYPSVGRSKDTNIAFYNVCGGIRFTLCQSGIRKIVLKGNNNETLGGKVKVQIDENGRPKVSEVVEGEKSITLVAPDDGVFQTGKRYYISVLPTELSKGFKVEFIKRVDESERGTRTVTSSVEVKRSIFGSIENLDNDVVFGVGIGSLSISPAEVLVSPMSAVQLSLTILPADAKYEWIKWSSTDKTIASVDEDGIVVGKKEGRCTITATSDNGASASCTVYVSQTPVSTKDASEISFYTATLNGSFNVPDTESAIETMFFLYSDTETTLDGLMTNGTKSYSSLSGSEFNSTVKDLKFKTKYYYVAAVIFSGQTYFGEVKTFTTSPIQVLDDNMDLITVPIIVKSESGSISVMVNANVSWTAKASDDWLSVDPASFNATSTDLEPIGVIISFTLNPLTESRTASITFSAEGVDPVVVTIYQEAYKGPFCDIKLQPGAYASDPTSDPTNTMVLVASGTGVKAIKYYHMKTSETEGKSDEELNAFVKANGKDFSSSWIDAVNGNGLSLSLTGCEPETSYTLLAYATSTDDDEAYFIRRSSTLGDYIYDDYTKDDEYMLIPSKQYLYGEYIFLAKTTESFNEPFTEREVQGNVTFTDGETSVDEDGFEYDWVNVNGMWNTVFNSKYGLTNDITQFDLYEGFLYMKDSDDLGDLVQKATGDVVVPAFRSMTRFEGTKSLFSLYGHVAGGIIDDNGTIAFFDTETYADQVDQAGDTFGAYSASLLWTEDMGWLAALRDFLFIPVEKYATVNVASVRAKVARVQKEIKSMRRNCVELRDSRVERAIKKVRSMERSVQARPSLP